MNKLEWKPGDSPDSSAAEVDGYEFHVAPASFGWKVTIREGESMGPVRLLLCQFLRQTEASAMAACEAFLAAGEGRGEGDMSGANLKAGGLRDEVAYGTMPNQAGNVTLSRATHETSGDVFVLGVWGQPRDMVLTFTPENARHLRDAIELFLRGK